MDLFGIGSGRGWRPKFSGEDYAHIHRKSKASLPPTLDIRQRKEVIDYRTACSSDLKLYASYFNEMLRKGIYLPPSQFEAQFLSIAHGDKEIETTIAAIRQAFSKLRNMR